MSTEGLIRNLNDRLKHLSTVMCEIASSILPIKNQIGNYDDPTKNKVLAQVKNLQNQSKIVN